MDTASLQLSWTLTFAGWLIAAIAIHRAYSLWRTNGELAQRYWKLKNAYDKLVEQHDAWCVDEKTDPNGISFDDLRLKEKS